MRRSAFRVLPLAAAALLAAPLAFGGSVSIAVKEGGVPAEYWPAPVKCGVPFPIGALKPGEPVALVDESGKPQTLQSAVTATWDPKGEKGVRWLLIDFTAERGRSYRLLFGVDATPAPQAAPIGKMENGRIVIDTGKLKANADTKRLDLFQSLVAANRPAIAADAWAGPYIEHEKRGVFRADLDPAATVVLEETGPVRATVKADGWYVNEAGEKFCRYSLRVHFFKGLSNIKVEHTFIYTGHSTTDKLRDMAIRLPLAKTRHQHSYMTFGAQPEEGPIAPVDAGSSSDTHMYQVMDSPDHRRFEWFLINGDDGKIRYSGTKAAGIMRGNTDTVSLAAVIRDAWQQYPFELEWNRGVATVHLWPKHGRLWDTTWDAQWYYLTDRQKNTMVRGKPKVDDKNFDAFTAKLRTSDAYGAAKTHEIWFLFNADADWKSLPMLHDYVHHPAYAHADLKWQCESKALDWVAHQPYAPVNFPDEEAFLATILDVVQRHTEQVGFYGWWDWGAYHQFFEDQDPLFRYGDNTFENTAYQPSWHRAKPKSHYLWGSFPWIMYMRTGEERWLRYAQSYTLYALDRDTVHDGEAAGQEYPYDNSEVHWIGGWQGAPGGRLHIHNLLEKNDAIYQFWLTGDRRPLDVLKMWANQFDKAWSPKEVYYDPQKALTEMNNIRNTGGRLRRLVSYYEATWDERFKRHSQTLAAIFPGADIRTVTPAGVSWFVTWMNEGLFRYWKVFGDERIKQTAIGYARYQSDEGAGMFSGGVEFGCTDWCTYGFELTGDELFLDLGRRMVDRQIVEWATRDALHPGAQKWRTTSIPRFMGAMAHAPEGWRAQNVPTHLKGVSLDYNYYERYASGDKTRNIYLLDEKDEAFTVQLASNVGKPQFAIFDPDGKIVARQVPSPVPSIRTRIEVPPDGKKGTYTLRAIAVDEQDMPPGERAFACMIQCSLSKVVYDAPAAPVERPAFTSRSWCFGVPAGVEKAQAHYRHGYSTFCAGLPCVVSQVGGDWRLSSADMPYRHFGGADIFRYSFPLPASPQPRLYRTGLAYRAHALGAFPDGIGMMMRSGFWIESIPPYISASPEAWFIPQLPKEYQKP